MTEKKRIVIKVGTSTLTHKTGNLNIRGMRRLTRIISDIKNSGREVILVSSGAMGLGMSSLGLSSRPKEIPLRQACAAVGQCELMNIYDDMFGKYNITVGQILLTKNILDAGELRQNIENTFETLLKMNVIPIVNENDTVATEELALEYGENDTLSAIVSVLVSADLLIILSDIDGLYDSDPRKNPDAKIIPIVTKIDNYIESIAGGAGSKLGTGGMETKINAAKIVTADGIDMVIINGTEPELLYELFNGNQVGTWFKSQ